MLTRISQKLFLTTAGFALFLSGCDNGLVFSEMLASCTPPKSSARFGKSEGPVITSPDAYTPSKGVEQISGTCVDGVAVEIAGAGVKNPLTVECSNGNFNATVAYSDGDGTKEIDVWQKNTSDENIMDRLCFSKDTVAPKVKISGSSGAQSIGKTTVQLTGVCENGLPVEISGPQLTETVTTACRAGKFGAQVNFTGPDGLKNVVAKQVDRAGNNGEDDKDYLTDTEAPVVKIIAPADMSYSTGIANITGVCESDLTVLLLGSAIQRPVKVLCENAKFELSLPIAGPDGLKTLQAQQSDSAGNTGRDERRLVKDATAPVVRFSQPIAKSTNSTTVTIAGTCESGLPLKLTGEGLSSSLTTGCNGSFSVSARLSSGDGKKVFFATQTDLAGNIGSADHAIELDTQAPQITINSPAQSELVKAYVDLQGNCESGLTVEVAGTGAAKKTTSNCASGSYTARVSLSAGDGQKLIEVSQTDAAGNTGKASREFIRDETGPKIQITSPADDTSSAGAMKLAGVCESGLTVNLSGHIAGQQVNCSNGQFSADIDLLGAIGAKTVVAEQTDKNGNKGSDKKTYRKVNNLGHLSFSSPGPGGKVDILFIDDNSSSMEQEQKRLGERFASFANELQNYDWQAGITTTDCSNGEYGICGSLLPLSGASGTILKPTTPNFLEVFKNTVQRSETYDPDTGLSCLVNPNVQCPSGNETPLRATIEAMNKRNKDNKGFFRSGADLAVLVLTDEDETPDIGGGITSAEAVVNQFKTIWPSDKKLSVYGIIIKPGDTACFNEQKKQMIGASASYGTKPNELANLTGGSSHSICEKDFTLTLRRIAQNVTKMNRTVELPHTPLTGSVRVDFNPAHTTKYVVEGNRVIFDDPAPVGTQVDIYYEY